MAPPSKIALPLSTWTYNSVPDYACVHGLLTSRVVAVESTLLRTPLSAWLLRYLSPRSVDVLLASAAAAAAFRLRGQWRALLSLAGTLEALVATLRALDAPDARPLRFWLVFYVLSFFEDLRTGIPGTPTWGYVLRRRWLAARWAARRGLQRLVRALLELNASQPYFRNVAYLRRFVNGTGGSTRGRSSGIGRFPQPIPYPTLQVAGPTPTPAVTPLYTLHTSEVSYRLLKLVLLWAALPPVDPLPLRNARTYLLEFDPAVQRCERLGLDPAGSSRVPDRSSSDPRHLPPTPRTYPSHPGHPDTPRDDPFSPPRLSSDTSFSTDSAEFDMDRRKAEPERPDHWSLATPLKQNHWTSASV